jgi:hypothetical protein
MMTPQRWQQIKEVLGQALELEPPERAGYLDGACTSDPSLRAEVERLLIVDRRAGKDFLDDAATRQDVESPPPTFADPRIGKIVDRKSFGCRTESEPCACVPRNRR